MMDWDALRGVTLRALRIDYISPAVCELAIISSGSGSSGSESSILNPTPVLRRDGPTNLVVTVNSEGEVVLTWIEQSYIFAYSIYASVSAEGPFVLESSNVIGNTATLPLAPGTYYFKVTGIEPEFGETFPSETVGPVIVP